MRMTIQHVTDLLLPWRAFNFGLQEVDQFRLLTQSLIHPVFIMLEICLSLKINNEIYTIKVQLEENVTNYSPNISSQTMKLHTSCHDQHGKQD